MIAKWIKDYKDRYAITTNGKVWSFTNRKKRVLKGSEQCGNGYYVHLRKNGITSQCRIAVLVLETFVGLRPEGLLACHKNGNKFDDNLENLYWGTYQENNLDTVKHGTHDGPKSETHHWAKLSIEDVEEIHRLIKLGVPQKKIGLKFGVTQSNISKIVNGHSRRHG